ncbi:MAG: hypothetical protein UV79_C0006G0004 [candidate division TM6 bacterium GW2011_GWF2_43_17]|nr:MAG: hypothetical protein UV79_C0006G0004 [candidate division TM6 bacterium GW2011_GWF2_43_17]HAU30572.1 hypothetical protein [Candidatus Dependentiae bacterium]
MWSGPVYTVRLMLFLILVNFFALAGCQSIFETRYMRVQRDEDSIVLISSVFGQERIREPLLVDLLQSPSLRRLASILQHGNWYYCANRAAYSRLEHSINVFLLVRKAGGSLLEQAAALLHDVSHTAFSHSGASFFTDDFVAADHLQDQLHEYYITGSDIKIILEHYDIAVADILPDSNGFIRLERELPDLCADRIEYNIMGGLYEGLITEDQARTLVQAIHFSSTQSCWYFDAIDTALLFSRNAIYMTIALWTSPYSVVSTKMLAYALRRAGQLGILTREDVLFGSDEKLFRIMASCNDALLQKFLGGFQDPHTAFTFSGEGEHKIFCKFRGVDPLILAEDTLCRLSEIERSFAWYYTHMKDVFSRGWSIYYTSDLISAIESIS